MKKKKNGIDRALIAALTKERDKAQKKVNQIQARINALSLVGYRAICYGDDYNYGCYGDYMIDEYGEEKAKEQKKKPGSAA